MRSIQGDLEDGSPALGIAAANWNQAITDRLLSGALARAEEIGIDDLTVLRMPGALELPLGAQALVRAGCQAVVAVGVVIKGETDHYEVVVRESSAGLARVALDESTPVANAVLAVHNVSQARDRAAGGAANRGGEAVEAAALAWSALKRLGAG